MNLNISSYRFEIGLYWFDVDCELDVSKPWYAIFFVVLIH